MRKLLLNLCPTGVIPTKGLNANAPISPDEILADTKMAYDKGVQMVHIHARDVSGNNTLDKDVYADIIRRIRNECPSMIICVSLTGRFNNTFEARSDVLNLDGDLKPDMGSLTLSSLNFSNGASVNTPDMIVQLAMKMKDRGVKPELEVFDVGMINYSKYLIKKGILEPPFYYNIILGNLFSAQADLDTMAYMVRALPEGAIYSFGGIGNYQPKITMSGVLYADGVRVGLEDNIYYDEDRKQLATNGMLVDRVIQTANIYGRELYTCDEAREMIGIGKR